MIAEALDSVLAQSYADWEAIVIDDGSVDDTREVVARYTDPRIHYFYKENGGLSSARNAGLERARGEFIAFLDSDDMWRPWKLAAQVELFHRHPTVGMSWTDMSAFADSGTILATRHLRSYYTAYSRVNFEAACTYAGALGELNADAPEDLATAPYRIGNIFKEMLAGNLVHPPTAIIRRERLRQAGGWQHEVTRGGADDYHFYLRITQCGPVALLDAPAILYRVHPGSITQSAGLREAYGDLNVITHWHDAMTKVLPKEVVDSRFAGAHAWVGAEELATGNTRAAMPHLWKSLQLNPAQPRVLIKLALSALPAKAVPVMRAAKRSARKHATREKLIRVGLALTGSLFLVYRLVVALQPEFVE